MNKLFLSIIVFNKFAIANCEFIVTNYSSTKLVAIVGFYNGESQVLNVPAKGVNNFILKSDLNCTSITNYGGGVSFIRLGQNINKDGGWVYSPNNDMYRALGYVRKDSTGAFVLSSTKKTILLKNTYKPDADKFSVTVEDAGVNQTIRPI